MISDMIDMILINIPYFCIPLGIGGEIQKPSKVKIPIYSNQVTVRQLNQCGTRIHLQGFAPTSSWFHLETTEQLWQKHDKNRHPSPQALGLSFLARVGFAGSACLSYSMKYH